MRRLLWSAISSSASVPRRRAAGQPSMRVVPQLTRPGFSREYDELWFDMRDVDVDGL
jgi:hypothetical protein